MSSVFLGLIQSLHTLTLSHSTILFPLIILCSTIFKHEICNWNPFFLHLCCSSGDPAAEEWSQWSVCSLTCGQGWQVRTRSCVSSPYGTLCSGALRETRMCNNTVSCPGEPGITGSGRFTSVPGDLRNVASCQVFKVVFFYVIFKYPFQKVYWWHLLGICPRTLSAQAGIKRSNCWLNALFAVYIVTCFIFFYKIWTLKHHLSQTHSSVALFLFCQNVLKK